MSRFLIPGGIEAYGKWISSLWLENENVSGIVVKGVLLDKVCQDLS